MFEAPFLLCLRKFLLPPPPFGKKRDTLIGAVPFGKPEKCGQIRKGPCADDLRRLRLGRFDPLGFDRGFQAKLSANGA